MKTGPMLITGLTLLGAFAAGAWLGVPGSGERPDTGGVRSIAGETSIEKRLARLENALNAEREARQLLEDELFSLYDALDSLDRGNSVEYPAAADSDSAPPTEPVRAARAGGRIATFGRSDNPDARRDALTRAGFTPARADWILAREDELRMQAMQARYDSMRRGESPESGTPWSRPESQLREEIGDNEYEMYLDANGRPTRVGIDEVFASSPAGSAGLQPGDEITHYDGERVFSTADLVRETMEGEPGENVVVSVVRDGAPMQVVLPRGPLGVSTRWRR